MNNTIKITGNHPEEIEGFIFVDEEQIGFDSEKGFAEYRVILKRESDGKYFRLNYTDFGRGQDDLNGQIAHEVQRKTKQIYYYE